MFMVLKVLLHDLQDSKTSSELPFVSVCVWVCEKERDRER